MPGWGKVFVAAALVVVVGVGALTYLVVSSPAAERPPIHPSATMVPPSRLSFVFAKGQSARYRVRFQEDGHISGGPEENSVTYRNRLSEIMAWHVLSVDRAGTATVGLVLTNRHTWEDGKTGTLQPASFQIRIARDGRILAGADLAPSAGNGPGYPGMEQFAPLLSGRPVRPGDSWTKSFVQSFAGSSQTLGYSTNNQFLALATVGSSSTAAISSRMTVPVHFLVRDIGRPSLSVSITGRTTVDQTAWLGIDRHNLVKELSLGRGRFAVHFLNGAASGLAPGTLDVLDSMQIQLLP
jgi:hypothetical protein